MNDKDIRNICLVLSVIGLIVLFIGVNLVNTKTNIGDIDESYIGKTVLISGNISSNYYNNGNVFLDVKDQTGKIKAVVFENTMKKLNINPKEISGCVEIKGSVNEYKGELEIIAERLE